jgi:hypothetical protein
MRYSVMFAVACAVLLTAACGRPQQKDMTMNMDMQAALNKMRAMISQSALLAAQAACADASDHAKIMEAAATMLRRATSGPEMASVHRMMGGEMNANEPAGMAAGGGNKPASPQMAMHTAVHAAGGDMFDVLDQLSGTSGLTCADIRPLALAATASLLRQQHEEGMDEATKKLDSDVDEMAQKLTGEAQQSVTDKTPSAVVVAAAALGKI